MDFFPPLTNDAYLYGQIAAANSLSDLYAMGARPVTALNIVCFPDDQLPIELLYDILRGGAHKTHEAGAVILGGHSVRDTEVKFGLSATGVIEPSRLITNEKAQPGDVLILTKAIGTGAMTAAYQKEKIDPEIWDEACAMMARLNRAASEAMVAAGAHAATDITGYGLVGHACELAEASGMRLTIDVEQVPQLRGALDLYASNFVTRAYATNFDYLENRIRMPRKLHSPLQKLIFDAQTSAGLLIALPESALDAFGKAMTAAGEGDDWRRIGMVDGPAEEHAPHVSLR